MFQFETNNNVKNSRKIIMSAISDFANQQNAFNDQISIAVQGLTGDISALNAKITELQNSPGAITPADQASLDAIQARAASISSKLTALDALTPPSVPAEFKNHPVNPNINPAGYPNVDSAGRPVNPAVNPNTNPNYNPNAGSKPGVNPNYNPNVGHNPNYPNMDPNLPVNPINNPYSAPGNAFTAVPPVTTNPSDVRLPQRG